MAKKKKSRSTMETCFKVLQHKFDRKLSNRTIGLTLNISPSTVFEVLARFKESSTPWPLPEALTPEQMALLTSDIVWLVDLPVTLSDGSIQQVRVPRVYAKLREGDLGSDGALLGGQNVLLSAEQDITGSGSISGNRVSLLAGEDILNTGGQILSGKAVSLLAGRKYYQRPPPSPAVTV